MDQALYDDGRCWNTYTTEEDMTALCPGGYEEFRPVPRGCTVQEKSRKIKGANG